MPRGRVCACLCEGCVRVCVRVCVCFLGYVVMRPMAVAQQMALSNREREMAVPRITPRGVRGRGVVPRDLMQAGYQLQVERLAGGSSAPLWDSGLVAGNKTLHVRYAGPALGPDQRFRWRVASSCLDTQSASGGAAAAPPAAGAFSEWHQFATALSSTVADGTSPGC